MKTTSPPPGYSLGYSFEQLIPDDNFENVHQVYDDKMARTCFREGGLKKGKSSSERVRSKAPNGMGRR